MRTSFTWHYIGSQWGQYGYYRTLQMSAAGACLSPIAQTSAALKQLVAAGRPVEVYVFPDTDHGMMEFTTNPDGSRTIMRVTDGYLRLLADWIKRDLHPPYGRGWKMD